MTFTDILTYPSKSLRCSSVGNDLHRNDQHRTLKRLNTSILNLFSRYRQTNNDLERQTTNEKSQQQDSFLYPPSDLSRSISNKSVTFALIFDESENENKHMPLESTESEEHEDLIIVVPNKYVNNELDTNVEPYPFRSEIPSCSLPRSSSSTNIINSSHSKKNFIHQLIHYHRPKKLRHPVETIPSINRSTSAPIMLCSLTSTPIDHHRSSKTFHRWFKFPTVTRFLQSFIKHPNSSNTKHFKQKSRRKSTTLRKYSEIFY